MIGMSKNLQYGIAKDNVLPRIQSLTKSDSKLLLELDDIRNKLICITKESIDVYAELGYYLSSIKNKRKKILTASVISSSTIYFHNNQYLKTDIATYDKSVCKIRDIEKMISDNIPVYPKIKETISDLLE